MNLVNKVCEVFGVELPDFAREIDMPKSTLQTWSDKQDNGESIPRYAVVMLEALIENKHLKEKDNAVKRVFELYELKPLQ